MKLSKKKHHKSDKLKEIWEKISNVETNPKTESIIEFDKMLAGSIKCLAVKKNNEVKPTTRFFRRKILMFAKISLKSFIYDLIETLYFPNKKEIYNKYMVEGIFPYHILTDIDSTSLFFTFICKPESSIPNSNFRDLLFEVFVNNEIINRFVTSHEFWEKFEARNTWLEIRNIRLI